ncbi:asparagine synthase (glutamine-hydrolyzing) [Marinisporobacter balticus]|uniref:asparagine synthase (glutamine-hydrolyzing) n=1 Tax=Marinisporobacter balticus TaxID=2018667 RepID=A0A4R2L4Q6_9FIRM|nr:asparagine synthase (glutamine-hydrolyzing) [Marinisporobacter balticus]TCO78826.1 asparagine synthase (glutamine-hydrolysing) [Marinisporobacter balticus]
MCGICGFINNGYNKRDLYEMNQSICHRGPDDEGYYLDERIGLAQKRLSILDLSSLGRQPMSDETGTITISFNGEIYNYKQIKAELVEKGYSFKTDTDTEVIVYAYKQWGIKCINKFNGMFAIAIWEQKKNKLTLVRDRIGIKPLYYYHNGKDFAFGSELKPIIKHPKFLKNINNQAINLYLTFGYIPAPYTIYENTFKLEPGKYLIFQNNKIEISTYWDIIDIKRKCANKEVLAEKEYLEQLEELLKSSIKSRLVSDVPIGAFLSGGIDSSLVVSLMQDMSKDKVKTFSIGFNNDKFNEANYAKEIAAYLGTDHTELYITNDDLFSMVEDLVYYYDEPFYDSSSIPTMLVSKLAKEKVTVALSGDGGDELFCGYNTYDHIKTLSKFHNLPHSIRKGIGYVGGLYNKRLSQVLDYSGEISEMVLNLKSMFSKKEIRSILLNSDDLDKSINYFRPYDELKKHTILDKEMISDIKSYMVDDILTKVDRASMKYALEARVPLLDHKIVEFSLKVPLEFKMREREKKYLLKQVLYKYLPKQFTNRPKKGFSVPIDEWVNGSLKNEIEYYFSKQFVNNQNIFHYSNLNEMRMNGKLNTKQIWCIFIFQKWYKKYFVEDIT